VGGSFNLIPKKTFKNGALYLAISSPSKSFKQGHFVESIGVFSLKPGELGIYSISTGVQTRDARHGQTLFPPTGENWWRVGPFIQPPLSLSYSSRNLNYEPCYKRC
jgi:hypothetical protein